MNTPAANPTSAINVAVLADRLNDAGRVVGRCAHDFNNVLGGVSGFAELALPNLAPGSPPHKFISDLLGVCRQGVSVTEGMHEFSRSGVASGQTTEMAVFWAMEQGRFRTSLTEGIKLEASVPGRLPPVRIAQDQLTIVMSHLINNAAEAMPAGGLVNVVAEVDRLGPAHNAAIVGDCPPGRYVIIRVRDSGPGIPPAVRDKLFREPFFTTKPRHRGLGLATVFRVLHAHGGGIGIDSAERQGTTVRVYLPVAGP